MKMNVIGQREFEHAYYDVAVSHINHNATWIPFSRMWIVETIYVFSMGDVLKITRMSLNASWLIVLGVFLKIDNILTINIYGSAIANFKTV